MEKTRVYNQRKYDVGMILQNGAERVVHPGSFILLSRMRSSIWPASPRRSLTGKSSCAWRTGRWPRSWASWTTRRRRRWTQM